jgi:hypothetical protein
MRGAGLGLGALLLTGCGLLPLPAGIQLTIPASPEVPALPVTVVDKAGIVRDASPAGLPGPVDIGPGTTVRPAGDDAVVVAWIGGACDDRAIVTVEKVGDRFEAWVESRSSAIGCSTVGVARAVTLSLRPPVGADAFSS